jgi:hypothetical protein
VLPGPPHQTVLVNMVVGGSRSGLNRQADVIAPPHLIASKRGCGRNADRVLLHLAALHGFDRG